MSEFTLVGRDEAATLHAASINSSGEALFQVKDGANSWSMNSQSELRVSDYDAHAYNVETHQGRAYSFTQRYTNAGGTVYQAIFHFTNGGSLPFIINRIILTQYTIGFTFYEIRTTTQSVGSSPIAGVGTNAQIGLANSSGCVLNVHNSGTTAYTGSNFTMFRESVTTSTFSNPIYLGTGKSIAGNIAAPNAGTFQVSIFGYQYTGSKT